VTIYSIPPLNPFLDIPLDDICFPTTIVIIFAHKYYIESEAFGFTGTYFHFHRIRRRNYFKLAAYLILILSLIVYSYTTSSTAHHWQPKLKLQVYRDRIPTIRQQQAITVRVMALAKLQSSHRGVGYRYIGYWCRRVDGDVFCSASSSSLL